MGIELRREPLAMAADDEITISYDLDRGSAERLYRYGFLEEVDGPSHAITIFHIEEPPRVGGGNVFQIKLASAKDKFRDLSFLTYENWYSASVLY